MSEHTPGPWKIGVKMDDSFAYAWPCYRLQLMGNPGDAEEVEATRRLIEAAPDLLDALEQAVTALEHWFPRWGDPKGANSEMMQQARAAIVKCSPH